MKVAVTGAEGLLGNELTAELRREGHEVSSLLNNDPDIRRFEDVRVRFAAFRPRWVFHLAAFTKVDECETKSELAREVNAFGAGNVAKAANEVDASVLMMSTDYVFDGRSRNPYREDDPTGPLSVYGRTKLEGEDLVRAANPHHLIVRTSWLYGHHGRCFPEVIVRKLRAGDPLRVVDDQHGAPTWTRDLSKGLLKLVSSGAAAGTVHCTAQGECTWYEFARHIADRMGIEADIQPISSSEFGAPAKRPEFSVLDNRKFRELTGHLLPDWKASANQFLEEELSQDQDS